MDVDCVACGVGPADLLVNETGTVDVDCVACGVWPGDGNWVASWDLPSDILVIEVVTVGVECVAACVWPDDVWLVDCVAAGVWKCATHCFSDIDFDCTWTCNFEVVVGVETTCNRMLVPLLGL